MKRILSAAFAMLALAAPAFAANWAVDPARSQLGFEVVIDGTPVRGSFSIWTAEIAFDPADLTSAHAKVTIDVGTANSGNGTRDDALDGDKWFDVANTPQAVFDTSAFRQTGEGAYEVDATLTMRGTAHPVTLPFTLQIANGEAHMTARLTIDRTLWNIGQGSYASDTPVATKVDVVIDLIAKAS
ncbi:Protein YceI [Alphaproteobacteria bacterium SO-S41]|nr:Protein YceI [Alphaproteobacteria bacterium SO-S41]